MKKIYLIFICVCCCLFVTRAQLYSPTERVYANNIYSSFAASNTGNVVDGDLSTRSSLVNAILNPAYVIVKFDTPVPANTPIHVKLGAGDLSLLSAFPTVSVSAGNNFNLLGQVNSVNGGTYSNTGLLGLLSGGNTDDVTVTPTENCQYVEVYVGGLSVAVTNYVYDVYYEKPLSTGTVACDHPVDELHGVASAALGLSAATVLSGVSNPQNAIDGNENTAASIISVLNVANQSYITALWPGLSRIGDSVRVILSQGSTALTLGLINGISIITYNNDTQTETIDNSSNLLSLRLLAGSSDKYVLSFVPSSSFNRVSVRYAALVSANLGVSYSIYEIERVTAAPTGVTSTNSSTTIYAGNAVTLPSLTPSVSSDVAHWYTDNGTQVNGSNTGILNATTSFYGKSSRNGCTEGSAQTGLFTAHVVTAIPPAAPIEVTPYATGSLGLTLGGDVNRLGNPTPTFKYTNITSTGANALPASVSVSENGTITFLPTGDGLAGAYSFTAEVSDESNSLNVGTKTFTITIGAYSLPVKYASELSAKTENGGNILSWSTAQEINNKGFRILRSDNGNTWTEIGFEPSYEKNGTGNGSSYHYRDNAPLTGINYYRLRQEDLDGNAELGKIVSVYSNGAYGQKPIFYPNPVHEVLHISNVTIGSKYRLLSLSGDIVSSGTIISSPATVPTTQFATGLYILELREPDGKNTTREKIMIKR